MHAGDMARLVASGPAIDGTRVHLRYDEGSPSASTGSGMVARCYSAWGRGDGGERRTLLVAVSVLAREPMAAHNDQ